MNEKVSVVIVFCVRLQFFFFDAALVIHITKSVTAVHYACANLCFR